MKEHALKEVQSHFPRQKSINAIDAFMMLHKADNKKFRQGLEKKSKLSLITPTGKHYSDRCFNGTELSAEITLKFNEELGLISFTMRLI